MKKQTQRKKASKKLARQTGLEWMDEDLREIASKKSIVERYELAETLERHAEQLRGFNNKRPKLEKVFTTLSRESIKAVVMFSRNHGGDKLETEIQISTGIRWILEAILPQIDSISEATCRQIKYCEAEGLNSENYSEARIRTALEKWAAKIESEKEDEDD